MILEIGYTYSMVETRWRYVCSECNQIINIGSPCTDVWDKCGKNYIHTWQHADCQIEWLGNKPNDHSNT
jgi:hypothetical protein